MLETWQVLALNCHIQTWLQVNLVLIIKSLSELPERQENLQRVWSPLTGITNCSGLRWGSGCPFASASGSTCPAEQEVCAEWLVGFKDEMVAMGSDSF